MSKEMISVEVEKSGYEAMLALGKLVGAVKQALKDGFQPGADLPAIVMEAISDLPVIMSQLESLAPDLAEDKLSFVKGVNLAAYDIAKQFLG